jgi:cytochrome c peroxidase
MLRVAVGAVCAAIACVPVFAASGPSSAETAWQAGAIGHAQAMRKFPDFDHGQQAMPEILPQLGTFADPSGKIGTEQSHGVTVTKTNPFFQSLGTNDRSCVTCHQPDNAWSVSAASIQARFAASGGADPIFRLVDGATCPSDDVSSAAAKLEAYQLLLGKGLLRIGLPIPAGAEFTVTVLEDPYGCNIHPDTGLTSASSGIVSIYRRPLPATNLGFLSGIMWDGREPSLTSQAIDATLGHAQADAAPNVAQQKQIVAFETGLATAQSYDDAAHDLNAAGANGGPAALVDQLSAFFIGINDPFGLNPTGALFNANIFTLFQAWAALPSGDSVTAARRQIARGEAIFNTMPITITGVGGINDAHTPSVSGSCGTCHDTPNVGNHSVKAPLDIGIVGAHAGAPAGLDISGLPVFSLLCTSGPLAGQAFTVTDPGRALISGKCADIGKVKGPILRGLSARAPYFHNGSAATLMDVVNFYDQRFSLGFTPQQKADLVAFLNAL